MLLCCAQFPEWLSKKEISRAASVMAVENALPLLGGEYTRLLHKESGQPYFCGREDVSVSISHSGGCVMVGASEKPVGVDVELLREPHGRLVERFCTEQEKKYIEASGDKRLAFLEIWTRREAYAKSCGKGLELAISANMCNEQGLADRLAAPDGRSVFLRNYRCVTGSVMAVCSEEPAGCTVRCFEPDEEWLRKALGS